MLYGKGYPQFHFTQMIEAHIIAGTIGTFFVKKFDLDFGGEDTSLPPSPPPKKNGSSWLVPSKVSSGLIRYKVAMSVTSLES